MLIIVYRAVARAAGHPAARDLGAADVRGHHRGGVQGRAAGVHHHPDHADRAVLGAGTDYGLFFILRVREEMGGGATPHRRSRTPARYVGESITFSAGTVIVALLACCSRRSACTPGSALRSPWAWPHAAGRADPGARRCSRCSAGQRSGRGHAAVQARGPVGPPRRRRDRASGDTLVAGVVFLGVLGRRVGYTSGGFGGQTTRAGGQRVGHWHRRINSHYPPAVANPTRC